MFRYVLLSVLIATVTCQYNQNSKTAAIISEQRYLSGDGKFGAAYTQEDGINFKEETDSDGTRHGSYSYVDPSGERKTVSYTAGKFGFQASGDHLPVAPPAPPQPIPTTGYQPNPRYQAPVGPSQSQGFSGNYDAEGQYDPRYNDPDFEGNRLPQSHGAPPPPPPPQPQYQPTAAPHYQYQHNTPQYNYQQQQPQHQQQQQQYQQHYETTPNPHRFLPPGKLQLNRTPDGFSYSFNKL